MDPQGRQPKETEPQLCNVLQLAADGCGRQGLKWRSGCFCDFELSMLLCSCPVPTLGSHPQLCLLPVFPLLWDHFLCILIGDPKKLFPLIYIFWNESLKYSAFWFGENSFENEIGIIGHKLKYLCSLKMNFKVHEYGFLKVAMLGLCLATVFPVVNATLLLEG